MDVQRNFDTGTNDILASVANGVGRLVLNRPDRRNAMSNEMIEGLARILVQFDSSDDVGAVVITGAGSAFCSGGDVKGFADNGGEGGQSSQVDPERVARQQGAQQDTVGRIHGFSKPTIAALPGAAAGAGLGIALAADLRIGTPRTLMATAFSAVGLAGDFGVAWLLNSLVGPARARELMFLGERVDATRCLDLGLVNWVVAEDDLASRTNDLAVRLAQGPRLALANMKRNLLQAQCDDLGSSMDAEVPLHMETGITNDHREAVQAFAEKREPRWGLH